MKSSKRKLIQIRLLMILSMLMLTLFVGKWLNERYIQEQKALRKSLSFEIEMTQDYVFDSLATKNIVEPFLAKIKSNISGLDSMIGNGKQINKYTIKIDTLIEGDHIIMDHKKPLHVTNTGDEELIEIKVIDGEIDSLESLNHSKNTFIQIGAPKGKYQRKMLLQSLKLMINSSQDSIKLNNDLHFSFDDAFDTAVFIQDFQQKLNDDKLVSVWVSNLSIDSLGDTSALIFKSDFGDKHTFVEVKNTGYYYWKKLAPNIIFALFLLIIVGAAFTFTFRTLKKQFILNEMRNDFVANISHELKTPVSTVKVALEAIQKYKLSEDPIKTNEYIDMASQELERLESLIGNVMISSIESKQQSLIRKEEFNLSQVIDEVLLSLRSAIEQKEAEISIIPPNTPFHVFADKMHMKGVLYNLIDNSLKYNIETPIIEIQFNNSENANIISVTDNGPGIPEDYLNKVFDKLFRVPTGNTHNVKGHGLGLNYAATIINQHNGTISVKNNKSKGCTFTVTIPNKKEE
jgi:signal transduction histidine kinase